MAITTQDGLIAARTNFRQPFSFVRNSVANMVAGQLCSLYRAAPGGQPVQPAIPAAAAVPTKALGFPFNAPTGAATLYLDALAGVGTLGGVLQHYDRVFHIGGLNGTVITAQAVNSEAVLTFPLRNSVAREVEWFLECYTDLGTTAVNATVAVTYTDLTTATIVVAVPASWRAGRLLPIVPAATKTIQSVQSVTLSASTLTAGSFGISAGDRFSCCALYLNANLGHYQEALLAKIADGACIWQVFICSTTATGDIRGDLVIIEG